MSQQRVPQDPQQPPVRQPSGIDQAGTGNDIDPTRHSHPERLRFHLSTAVLRDRPHQPLGATRPPNHLELSNRAPVPPENPPILDIQAADRALHLDSPSLGARNHSVYPNVYTQREFCHFQATVPPDQQPISYLNLGGESTRPWWTEPPRLHPSHVSLRTRFAQSNACEVPNYTPDTQLQQQPTIADVRQDYISLEATAAFLNRYSQVALDNLRSGGPPTFESVAIESLQAYHAVDQLIVANRVAHLEQDVYRLRNINNDLLATIHTFRANQDFQYLITRELALQAGLSVPVQLLRVPNYNYFNDIRFQGNHTVPESADAIPIQAEPRYAFQDIVPPNESNPPPWPTQVHDHAHFYGSPQQGPFHDGLPSSSRIRRHPDATTAFGRIPKRPRP